MLGFLLDIVEVAEVRFFYLLFVYSQLMVFESHTGVVLAKAFQAMLERFELQEKVRVLFSSDRY